MSSIRLLSLVLALVALVHDPAVLGNCLAAERGPAATSPAEAPGRAQTEAPAAPAEPAKRPVLVEAAELPRPAAEMVDAILTAVHSGAIEDLRTAIEWNELKPVFAPAGNEDQADPIAFLKKASRDGNGAEILAILGNLLASGASRQPLGRDFENNSVYVWPHLADIPLAELTPAETVELYRMVPADEIAAMRKAGRWTWYRLVIGADGTWHSFMPHH